MGDPALSPEAAPEPVLETAAHPGSTNPGALGPTGTTQSKGSTGATTTEANLRSGPGVYSTVLTVLPPGAALSIDGPVENGFVPVTGNGVSGWVAADLLGAGAAVAAPPAAPDANAPSGDVP